MLLLLIKRTGGLYRSRLPAATRDEEQAKPRGNKRRSVAASSGTSSEDDDDVSMEVSSGGLSEASDDEPSAVRATRVSGEAAASLAQPSTAPLVIVGEHSNGER